jgi:hypothetical protein
VPLQRSFNAAGTTRAAWAGSPGQHHGAGGELPGPRALGTGTWTEDPDGIRIVLAEVPCRSPSAPCPATGVTSGTANRLPHNRAFHGNAAAQHPPRQRPERAFDRVLHGLLGWWLWR